MGIVQFHIHTFRIEVDLSSFMRVQTLDKFYIVLRNLAPSYLIYTGDEGDIVLSLHIFEHDDVGENLGPVERLKCPRSTITWPLAGNRWQLQKIAQNNNLNTAHGLNILSDQLTDEIDL